MDLLAGWLVICFISASALAARPVWLLGAALAIRILLPSYASNVYMPGLHMAGYLIFATTVMQFILYRPRFVKTLLSSKYELAGFSLLVTLMLLNSVSAYSSLNDIVLNILVVYLTPFIFYLLVKMEVYRIGISAVRILSVFLHLVMLYELWLAIQQNETGRLLVFEQYAQEAQWFQNSEEVGRSYGTLETGLELSTLCILAVAMTYWVKNNLVRISLIIAYIYVGVLGTGRAALIISAVIALAVVFFSRSSVIWKFVQVIIMAFGVAFLYSSEAGQSLVEKATNDGGSTQLRVDAYTWVSNNYQYFLISGYTGNRDLRTSGQIGSSLENAYLIAGLDYGLLFAGLLLIFQVSIIIKNLKTIPSLVMGMSAAGIIVVSMTNSGFTTNSASAYLIWFALGLTAVGTWVGPDGYLGRKSTRRLELSGKV